MILFFALLVVVALPIARERGGAQFIAGTLLVAAVMLSLAGLEIVVSDIDFFKSDEVYYKETALNAGLIDLLGQARSTWFLVNYWVLKWDISLGGFALKLISIPLFLLLVYSLYKIFGRSPLIWLLPLCLPYTLWTATFNLRDMMIYGLTALTVLLAYNQRVLVAAASLFPLLLVFFLRPVAAAVIIFVIGLIEAIKFVRELRTGRVSKARLAATSIVGILFAGALIALWPVIFKLLRSYLLAFLFALGDGREARFDRAGGEAFTSSSLIRDFGVALVRYSITPLPTSLLSRMAGGGSEVWGLVDDGIRFIHQTIYFGMTFYVIVFFRTALSIIKGFSSAQVALFLVFFSYWPLYSFYHFGVTHQRTKLALQILVFLGAVLVYERRRFGFGKQAGIAKGLRPVRLGSAQQAVT